MKSIQKGELAQLKVEIRAIEKGYTPSRPTAPARYDLIVDDGNRLWRVQVKYAGAEGQSEGALVASLNYTDRAKVEHAYSVDQVDALAVYAPSLEEVFWFGTEHFCGKQKLFIKTAGRRMKNSLWYEDHVW